MNRRLPVTLVGGFLGAGKTSLLHHFISEHGGGHLAVFVESPGAVNLDAKALRGLCGAMRREHDTVLEIPAGDEAAQVAWMADRLKELFHAGRYERVLIEVAGTANPARLEKFFAAGPEGEGPFAPWAELRQIVCVVDALDFFRAARLPAPDALAGFQRAQIAGANLLVLNKCDLVDDAQRNFCLAQLRATNPGAFLVDVAYGLVSAEVWKHHPPLPPALSQHDADDGAAPALAATLYRAYRPFHPARFWDWFNADHPGLLRVKGIVWLATRSLLVGGVSRTRWENSCGGAGIWWAALPREDWPSDVETLLKMGETWREPYGDRRQELVLIGEPATLAAVARGLNACLLNDAEHAGGLAAWSKLPDPFPQWDLGESE